jgi:ribonuclease P protein component
MKRKHRLRRNSDFQQVRRIGKFYASPFMALAFLRNELGYTRFGFVVSKRLGTAVQRNKIKRRLREATRLRAARIKPGFDLIFIAKPPLNQASYTEIEQFIEDLLQRSELWAGNKLKMRQAS